jgi:hypothetical protein
MVKIDWTDEKKEAVIKAVNDFLIKNELTCGESVMQSDRGNIGSIEVMSDIADIVEAEHVD